MKINRIDPNQNYEVYQNAVRLIDYDAKSLGYIGQPHSMLHPHFVKAESFGARDAQKFDEESMSKYRKLQSNYCDLQLDKDDLEERNKSLEDEVQKLTQQLQEGKRCL